MNIEAQNLDSLRKLVRELQEEDTYLKEKLKKANIAYSENSVFEEKLIKLLIDSGVVEPVAGHGKGKYRFK